MRLIPLLKNLPTTPHSQIYTKLRISSLTRFFQAYKVSALLLHVVGGHHGHPIEFKINLTPKTRRLTHQYPLAVDDISTMYSKHSMATKTRASERDVYNVQICHQVFGR